MCNTVQLFSYQHSTVVREKKTNVVTVIVIYVVLSGHTCVI